MIDTIFDDVWSTRWREGKKHINNSYAVRVYTHTTSIRNVKKIRESAHVPTAVAAVAVATADEKNNDDNDNRRERKIKRFEGGEPKGGGREKRRKTSYM